MGDLSRNFSRWEFRCPDGCGYADADPALVRVLQAARDRKGEPLEVVSGARCSRWNRRVGGKWFSQHLRGRAADVPGGYLTPAEWMACGAIGVGVRGGRVVHVDVTPRRRAFVFAD